MGAGGDELPATALLLGQDPKDGVVPIAGSAPRVGPRQAWRWRFNLRGPSALLVEVTEGGPIAVHADGLAVEATIDTLGGQRFAAIDSAGPHEFTFNEAVSFLVDCADQTEIDRYWEALSAVPEAEQCGWLKDRFGVSWQIVPAVMDSMMSNGSPEQIARVTQAFLKMKKFDLADLQGAYAGA
jgi:predicted 3-demethylubiquinone-9 3-methyltransferase (glyoxalase superfamily)